MQVISLAHFFAIELLGIVLSVQNSLTSVNLYYEDGQNIDGIHSGQRSMRQAARRLLAAIVSILSE